MYTEDELRTMLANHASSRGATIDTTLVIRRSGRRRHVRQAVVGGATTLAVVGLGAAAIAGIRTVGGSSASSSSIATGQSPTTPDTKSGVEGVAPAGGQPQTGLERAPAEKLNLCGSPVASVAPNAAGLVLTVQFPATAAAGSTSVAGTVTLTNTGPERILGSTAATPAITLSRDGVTVWHSNGPMIAIITGVDLAPGASMSYPASFSPVVCSVEDDSAGSFRADLPHAAPGAYALSAAIGISRMSADGKTLSSDLVTGPLSVIALN